MSLGDLVYGLPPGAGVGGEKWSSEGLESVALLGFVWGAKTRFLPKLRLKVADL